MAEAFSVSVWRLLNGTSDHRALQKTADAAVIVLITLILGAVLVRSVPTTGDDVATAAELVWFGCSVLLGIEYLARLWSAPAAPTHRYSAPVARLRYVTSFLGVIDLASAGAYLLAMFHVVSQDVAEVISLFALCKAARFLPGLHVLITVFKTEARALVSALVALLIVLVITSGIMFLLERGAQPEVFTSIPTAMWWGIVTIASVGYGDMTPITVWGRIVGGLVIIIGLSTVAVPVGILATGFYRELRKHDFIVTWKTVSEVPLFKGLDASRIAEIARMLKPQMVPERQAVVRRGEPAGAMFFILEGEVEVDVQPSPVRLGKGQYFGEIALIRDIQRTATVTTTTDSSLLALDVSDFRRLMTQYPDIKESIERVAAERFQAPKS
ncbi:MAG: cyclic nucleotide-gated ion channel [Alphaproteobacteria bacterium]